MRFIVLIVALLISTTALAQTKPKLFVADRIYSVNFGTDKPRVLRDTLQGQNGNADRATYVVEKGPVMRMLGTMAPQGGMASDDGEAYFDSMIDSLKNGMPNMRIVTNKSRMDGAYHGREMEATNSQVTIVARMFVTHKGLVFAQAAFPNQSTTGRASASAFLSSLTITSGQ
ncbi:hypothetical protein J7J08_13150 [Stenotrophomonas sp. ISL-67]|uniref:hypothetical protein n=1 Tax=Stenotrophomonas sp. ISL-67 TaxID=2819171 RepID=UPI001BEBE4B5|nr:hypothetical protein [Stenotrophomonas sp. ISL-67]MBT2768586.1 hypothetical protein [Stenotrophomonas sp. ISL-67]